MKVLYYHGGSGNHGCEAIVRSTYNVLESSQMILLSKNSYEDKKYELDKIVTLKTDSNNVLNKKSLRYIFSILETKLFGTTILTTKQKRKDILDVIHKNDIALSIGGDNYCYPGYEVLSDLNYLIHKKGAKTVLWGCSIEPSLLKNKNLVEDMKRYDLITVRESLSYQGLLEAGISENVVLCSDPAFTLDKIDLSLPNNFIEGNTVGINVSPLIMSCEKKLGITKQNYLQLVDYIIKNSDMNVALIPHVVWKDNDDREPLIEIYEKFKDTNRICMIEDCNCMELKGYISRCRFFIGARTHATIAAYSTCVPTLVVGYSIKAKGIAKDIFGTYKNYVIPVQMLENEYQLVEAFKWLRDNEKVVREKLGKVMPNYIAKALTARKKFEELSNERSF